VKIRFVAKAPAAPGPVATAQPVVAEKEPPPAQGIFGSYQRPVAYAVLGAGAVGLIVGGVSGALASSKQAELRKNCPANECGPAHHEDVDSFETTVTLSYVGLVAGTVLVGFGGYLYLSDTGSSGEAGVAVRLLPTGAELIGYF
jgi:hypothetical protein